MEQWKRHFGYRHRQNLITAINDANEITHNDTLSLLVIQSGGFSHEAKGTKGTDGYEPAYVGLLDQVLAKLQESENTAHPNHPKTLTYDDIKPKAPVHLAVIREVLQEREQEGLLYDVMANNSDLWPLEKRQNAENLMHETDIAVPSTQTNLTQSWKLTMSTPLSDEPDTTSDPSTTLQNAPSM